MIDLLLPSTDAGVAAQFAVVALVSGSALLALRRHPEWRLLVIGAALTAFGAMAIRAIH